MNNRQIVQNIKAFREARQGWMDRLNSSHGQDSVEAAQHVLSCNSKIEFLKILWNWSDESVEFPS